MNLEKLIVGFNSSNNLIAFNNPIATVTPSPYFQLVHRHTHILMHTYTHTHAHTHTHPHTRTHKLINRAIPIRDFTDYLIS